MKKLLVLMLIMLSFIVVIFNISLNKKADDGYNGRCPICESIIIFSRASIQRGFTTYIYECGNGHQTEYFKKY